MNTNAKNVIIFDNKIAKKNIDYFTFNNIAGRSGRMFKHFIGHIYLFHSPPDAELPIVDFPLFSQDKEVSDRLLIQMDPEDLNEDAKKRVQKYYDQGILDIDIIKGNAMAEPENQIALAAELLKNTTKYQRFLQWTGIPTKLELDCACNLIWDYLVGTRGLQSGVSSGRQLSYRIRTLQGAQGIRELIAVETARANAGKEINDVIEDVLDFVRIWPTYKFPKLLMVLDAIHRSVFQRRKLKPGDFSFFATQIENLFVDPAIMALDEYGLPIQIAKKLVPFLKPDGDLDPVLQRLKKLPTDKLPFGQFEKDFIRDVQQYL